MRGCRLTASAATHLVVTHCCAANMRIQSMMVIAYPLNAMYRTERTNYVILQVYIKNTSLVN